jgi:phage recombination protein Bet
MAENAVVEMPKHRQHSLVATMASKYQIEPERFLSILKATAFKASKGRDGQMVEVTNEQMASLLVVANVYGLNPFTKEIYAFPDQRGGIVPVVSIDGWSRIINDHPQCDGIDFETPPDEDGKAHAWIRCIIYRKDRAHPTRVTEYLAECVRATDPWKSHPRRMLRHKALIQCARVAFGFAGIYDPDEGERIIEGGTAEVVRHDPKQGAGDALKERLGKKQPKPADVEQGPTQAEVMAKINKATTVEEVQDAASLMSPEWPIDQQQEVELRVSERLAELEAQA